MNRFREQLRHVIGGVSVPGADNLAIVLCTYFTDHPDQPEDDPETEHGWGEWVEDQVDKTIHAIIEAVMAEAEQKVPLPMPEAARVVQITTP